jgi:oligoribonuclease
MQTSPPTKFLWIDLEMTGLEPDKDVILELAAEITDSRFETIDSYEACIQQDKNVVLRRMQANPWWKSFPANRDDFLRNLSSGKPLVAVEKELVRFAEHYFHEEPIVLAGNSIHNDRLFIRRWMPEFDVRLHYRMLDVSAWKVVMQSRFGILYEKPEVHRAFEDIQASIAELQYYIEWLQQNDNSTGT